MAEQVTVRLGQGATDLQSDERNKSLDLDDLERLLEIINEQRDQAHDRFTEYYEMCKEELDRIKEEADV